MGANTKPILITLGVVAAIVVGFLIYVALSPDEKSPPVVVQQPIAVPDEPAPVVTMGELDGAEMPDPMAEPEEEAPVVAESEETPAFMLPRLGESDDLIRDGVISLSGHNGMVRWLAGSDLIRKFVATVDNIAAGKLPRQQLTFLAPDRPLSVSRESEEVYVLSEASYRRFDLVTEIFLSVDAQRAVEFYSLLRPLFQQAYGELGYGNRSFDDVIFVAIGRLLETPTPAQPIKLVRPAVVYEYADQRLEKLSDAQKQLIRMGPKNTRAIQAKLSEFALELRTLLRK